MKNKKPVIQGTHIALDDSNPLANFTILNSIGEGTFGKVHLDTRHVPELRNPVLVLAKLLWNNDDNLISKSLLGFKATSDEIKGVLFLKSLYQHFKDFDKLVFGAPKLPLQDLCSKPKKPVNISLLLFWVQIAWN